MTDALNFVIKTVVGAITVLLLIIILASVCSVLSDPLGVCDTSFQVIKWMLAVL